MPVSVCLCVRPCVRPKPRKRSHAYKPQRILIKFILYVTITKTLDEFEIRRHRIIFAGVVALLVVKNVRPKPRKRSHAYKPQRILIKFILYVTITKTLDEFEIRRHRIIFAGVVALLVVKSVRPKPRKRSHAYKPQRILIKFILYVTITKTLDEFEIQRQRIIFVGVMAILWSKPHGGGHAATRSNLVNFNILGTTSHIVMVFCTLTHYTKDKILQLKMASLVNVCPSEKLRFSFLLVSMSSQTYACFTIDTNRYKILPL